MSNKKLILLAAGGHGRVVLDALLAQNLVLEGILDPALTVGSLVLQQTVIGPDDWLLERNGDEFVLANGAGAIPGSSLRRRLFERWKAAGFSFATVHHPSAVVARGVTLMEGCQLMAGAIVQTGSAIGENAVVNTGARVDHDCRLGAHAFIGPGAILCGGVSIAANVFVGAGAVLLQGITVGEGSVVGAGAVVTQNVAAGVQVVGNPARPRPPKPL
jgi:sugar O-acyltransferase (sialic acid O-acetyltransferase NeuD family)